MGNTQTTDGNKKSLKQIIDFVATNYILTQNFQDMRKLSDMKYCNKLVILTSKVIEKKLSPIEVEFLAQRTKDGEEINVMSEDNLAFTKKDDLGSLDVKNQTDKRRMCIGIARYYVIIAHIYAAIVTTIKPNYTYTEGMSTPAVAPEQQAPEKSTEQMNKEIIGGDDSVPLEQKQNIPAGSNVKVKINNLCSKRLNALLNNQDINGEEILIKPNFCKMNLDATTNKPRTLASEPGIPELDKLYYDVYNFDQGGFTGMSVEMAKVYLKDVQTFYKIFTGEQTVPDNVKTFSDVPLKALYKSQQCIKNAYANTYKGSIKEKLFQDYVEHMKKMMATTETNQNKLLAIIDKIFIFEVNPITKAREVTIRPNITEDALQRIVTETRNIIINLYITCEQDFLTGIEIIEAIVENQVKETTNAQLSNAALEQMVLRNQYEGERERGLVPAIKAESVPVAEPVPVPAALVEPAALEHAALGPAALESVVIDENKPLEPAALEPAPLVEPAALVPAPLGPAPLESVVIDENKPAPGLFENIKLKVSNYL